MSVNPSVMEVARKLLREIPAERCKLREPMSKHTSFQIGGPADILVVPASLEEIRYIFCVSREHAVPVTVLGNGSNVLVRDKGVRGVVMKITTPLAYMYCDGHHLVAGAGALLSDVARFAAENSLAGFEFAVGIPGTIGGAVVMNAGAYEAEMKDVVFRVSTVTVDGSLKTYRRGEMHFGYRQSPFQEGDQVVVEVELALTPGDRAAIEAKMRELTRRREAKQPLRHPSAGSTFKRPPGHYAGTLIEQAGLKGFRIGDAQVSELHAGFIVNCGRATAADVLELIAAVQEKVAEKFGVTLTPEVKVIGEE